MNLVPDGGLVEADLVGLPERGDFSEDQRLVFARVGIGKRQLVQTLEISCNTAALQTNRVARDFGWVSGKDGRYFYLV